jgi:hypothetical protein
VRAAAEVACRFTAHLGPHYNDGMAPVSPAAGAARRCAQAAVFIMVAAAGCALADFPKRGTVGIDLNYPGLGIRYFTTDRLSWELRGQYEPGAPVIGVRGYFYQVFTPWAPTFLGIEADYIANKGRYSTAQGMAGEVFLGTEVLVRRRFSVQFDFGPAWIYLKDGAYNISQSGIEYVVNFGLNYYFLGAMKESGGVPAVKAQAPKKTGKELSSKKAKPEPVLAVVPALVSATTAPETVPSPVPVAVPSATVLLEPSAIPSAPASATTLREPSLPPAAPSSTVAGSADAPPAPDSGEEGKLIEKESQEYNPIMLPITPSASVQEGENR